MPDFDRIYHYGGGVWVSRHLEGLLVAFDTHRNRAGQHGDWYFPINDPSDNFVALAALGSGNEELDISHLATLNLSVPLRNSGIFDVDVEFGPDGRVTIYLSNTDADMDRALVIDHTIDSFIPFDGYVGFISATGLLHDRHILHSVSYESAPTVATGKPDASSSSVQTPNPGFATFGNFRITHAKANYPEEAVAAVRNEFGNEWRVADWNDLREAWSGHKESIKEVFEGTAAGATIVTRNGVAQWGDRTYFVEDHNGSRPGYFLAHHDLGGHEISLGSWYIWEWGGDGLRVLAVRKSE